MIKINIYRQEDKIWQEFKQEVGAALHCAFILYISLFYSFAYSVLLMCPSTDRKYNHRPVTETWPAASHTEKCCRGPESVREGRGRRREGFSSFIHLQMPPASWQAQCCLCQGTPSLCVCCEQKKCFLPHADDNIHVPKYFKTCKPVFINSNIYERSCSGPLNTYNYIHVTILQEFHQSSFALFFLY